MALDFFFNPKSIALVGASPTPGKISAIILESLRNSNFSGRIYPVNPGYGEISGLRCYTEIDEIEDDVDLAVYAIPAEAVVSTVARTKKEIKGAIIISGGFGETGKEGRQLEKDLKTLAREKGTRIIGPNCMGIFDTVTGLDTFFIPRERMKRPSGGGLSIISQSGSFAVTALDELAAEGIGVARVVSYGNRVDVNEADCLEFLASDEATKAVVIYMESVEEGRRFVEEAALCSKKKPVAAVKVGKTEAAATAALSHTGALAGRYEIYRAAFKKAGVVELRGYEEFLDACRVLGSAEPAPGRRVMIITDGGGIGVELTDECSALGLDVLPLTVDIKENLVDVLPSFAAIGNPLDLTGSATDNLFAAAIERTMEGGLYDLAIVAPLWGPPGLTEKLPEVIAIQKRYVKKPVIICTPGGEFTRSRTALFREAGLPVFTTPEGAARAAHLIAQAGER